MECPDSAPRPAQVSKTGGVTARRFNRAKFMAELKIRPEAMALFASAIGNDFVGQARSLSRAHTDMYIRLQTIAAGMAPVACA